MRSVKLGKSGPQWAVEQGAVTAGKQAQFSSILISFSALVSSWTGLAVQGINVADVALALTVLAVVASWVFRRRKLHIKFWMIAPLIGVLIATAFSVIGLGQPIGSSGDFAVRAFLSMTIVAIAVLSERDSYGLQRMRELLGWWAAGVALSASAAVLSNAGLVDLTNIVDAPLAGARAVGLAFHPNSLAFSLVIAVPVQMFIFVTAVRQRAKWAALIGFALCIAALVAADSRSGLGIGLVVGVLSIAAALRIGRARWLSLPIALLGLVAIAVWVLPLLGQTRLGVGAGSASDVVRAEYNGRAWRTISEHPFLGTGVTGMEGVSIPLNLLTVGGFVFAALYYTFVFAGSAPIWRSYPSATFIYGGFVLASILGFGINGNGAFERATFWPLLLIAGIAAASPPPSRRAKALPARIGR